MSGDPGIWIVLAAVVLGVLVLRVVVALALRLALVGALILAAAWLWRSGMLGGLGGLAG